MNELALFAGGGGGILGGLLLGWRTRVAVEINPYGRAILLARQRDGMLPMFPIWDDVRTFDGKPWRGSIDVISGGFPCQDISAAGKGAGITGARSGLWSEFARIIREVEPRHVFVENSPMLVSRGLGQVLGDLAAMGFDCRWGVLGAAHAGAPHRRERIWIVATHPDRELLRQQPEPECRGSREAIDWSDGLTKSLADSDRQRLKEQRGTLSGAQSACAPQSGGDMAHAHGSREPQPEGGEPIFGRWARDGRCSISDTDEARPQERMEHARLDSESSRGLLPRSSWWKAEPNVGRVAHGVASRVDRLTALGNGQVSRVAALAWRILTQGDTQ